MVYAPSLFLRVSNRNVNIANVEITMTPTKKKRRNRSFQGQFFSGSTYRIYLLGNPLIWWGNIVFLIIFLVVFTANAIKQQRNLADSNNTTQSFQGQLCTQFELYQHIILYLFIIKLIQIKVNSLWKVAFGCFLAGCCTMCHSGGWDVSCISIIIFRLCCSVQC